MTQTPSHVSKDCLQSPSYPWILTRGQNRPRLIMVQTECKNNVHSHVGPLVFGATFRAGFSFLSFGASRRVQYMNCRRDPGVVVVATRLFAPPGGAVSVPEPRTPKENILSNTAKEEVRLELNLHQGERTHVLRQMTLRWSDS